MDLLLLLGVARALPLEGGRAVGSGSLPLRFCEHSPCEHTLCEHSPCEHCLYEQAAARGGAFAISCAGHWGSSAQRLLKGFALITSHRIGEPNS